MTHHEEKVLHCVNKRNATLSIISCFLLYSSRRKSQLKLIQYIFEFPVKNFFRLLSTFYYFRFLEGRTTNQTPENDRIGSFDKWGRSGVGEFSLLRNVQTGSGVYPVFWMGIGGSLSGDKAARVWGWLRSKRVPRLRMIWAIPPLPHLCLHDVQGQLIVATYKFWNT